MAGETNIQQLEDAVEGLKFELAELNRVNLLNDNLLKKKLVDLFYYTRNGLIKLPDFIRQLSDLLDLPEKETAQVFDLCVPLMKEANYRKKTGL